MGARGVLIRESVFAESHGLWALGIEALAYELAGHGAGDVDLSTTSIVDRSL